MTRYNWHGPKNSLAFQTNELHTIIAPVVSGWIIWIKHGSIFYAFRSSFRRRFQHFSLENISLSGRWSVGFALAFCQPHRNFSIYQDLYSLNMGNQTTNKNVTVPNYQISNVEPKSNGTYQEWPQCNWLLVLYFPSFYCPYCRYWCKNI